MIIKNIDLKQEFKPQDLYVINKDNHTLLVTKKDNHVQLVLDITGKVDNNLFANRKSFPAVYDNTNHILDIIRFIELQGKTSKSLLNSVVRVNDLTDKTALSVGINELGNMYSLYDFGTSMRKQGKKPIFGAELYMESLPQKYIVQLGDTIEIVSQLKKVPSDTLKKDNPHTFDNNGNIKSSMLNINDAKEANHIVLLAKNYNGYQNIMYLTSVAQVNREYDKPQLTWNDLKKRSKDIIALSGTENSEFYRNIHTGNLQQAEKVAQTLLDTFHDDFYIAVFNKGIEYENDVKQAKVIANKLGIKTVAVDDFKMLNDNQGNELKVLQTIATDKTIKQNFYDEPGNNYYYHSSTEGENEFSNDLESVDNTIEVYQKIENFDILPHKLFNPKFPLPEGYETQNEYFEYLVHKGFHIRMKQLGISQDSQEYPKYVERLHHEMDVIESMNYAGYFIVVADFINYAKRNYDLYDEETANRWKRFAKDNGYSVHQPIAIGYGRGSAAGSLVSYSMFITEINPIPYDLLFERFLNKDRAGMPDIDTDIPDNKRPEVLDYVTHFYNYNDPQYVKIAKNDPSDLKQLDSHVAGIITFGTLKGKQVLRDVTRVYGQPVSVGNKLAKLFNNAGVPSLSQALEEDADFSDYANSSDEIKQIVDMSIKLEYLEKSESQHACGKVITPDPVTTYLPVTYLKLADGSGKYGIVTQVRNVEDFGLLKMDFLGLRTMNVLNTSLSEINAEIKTKNDENGTKIPYESQHSILQKAINDLDTYKFMRDGHTYGVFQFASAGMKDLVHRMFGDIDTLPDTPETGRELFDRLSAATALFRPGPMQFIDTYIDNMNSGKITYQLPQLESILKETYGVTVYQEQVMMITRKIAGFSLNDADHVRKAMGHKIPSIMAEYKGYFLHGSKDKNIDGAVKHIGITEEQASKLWDTMESFASYGFNKSHAVSYTYLSVIEAYLSLHYPEEFYTAQLNTLIGKADKVSEALVHINERNLTILPADVNESQENFAVSKFENKKAIRFGLSGIKRMGTKATEIIADREQNGKYKDLLDFILRQNAIKNFNKTVYEALTYSGAFDTFKGSRNAKIKAEQRVLDIAKYSKNSWLSLNSQSNLKNKLIDITQYENTSGNVSVKTTMDDLIKEKEYSGYFISDNPLNKYLPLIQNDEDYITLGNINKLKDGEEMNTLVIIDEVKEFTTKNMNKMANILVEDKTHSTSFTAFSTAYLTNLEELQPNKIVSINFKVRDSDNYGRTLELQSVTPADLLLSEIKPQKIVYALDSNKDIAKDELDKIIQWGNNDGIKIPFEYKLGYKSNKTFNRTKEYKHLETGLTLQTLFNIQELIGSSHIFIKYAKENVL